MSNITRKNRIVSDNCSIFVLIMVILSSFLLLFSYTNSLTRSEVTFHRRNLLFNRIDEDLDDIFTVQRYTWTCRNNNCEKNFAGDDEEEVSLNTCNMMCSKPSLWPTPANLQITDKGSSIIDKTKISFNLPDKGIVLVMLQNTTNLFLQNLDSLKKEDQIQPGTDLIVNMILSDVNSDKLRLNTNESYQLTVVKNTSIEVNISAENYFGARHGLETLSQLIWYDETINELKILHDVSVQDYPKFPYRGLMVDTARNFFPVTKLKKVVDGMAMSKLNVLHLHATDAVSFPLVLPKMTRLASFGAYGPEMIYTPKDINNLVKYALIRGIRVILEVDAPSHVYAGWNFGGTADPKNVICAENNIFNGHLNPDNEETLNILEAVYTNLLELNQNSELFHIGSDEVNLTCWQNTNSFRTSGQSLKQFWASYTDKMLDRLKKANNDQFPDHVIMWSSPLTETLSQFESLSKKITVQHWLGNPLTVLNKGHNIIYSTVGYWYLDCGFGPWKPSMNSGVCDPYTPWQKFYNYRPWSNNGYRDLALGGEVCLWTEQVEIDTLETRIWPRSAAFAERVWSDPTTTDEYDVYRRLVSFSDRLKSRGIQVAGIWPRWCSQNPGKC